MGWPLPKIPVDENISITMFNYPRAHFGSLANLVSGI